MSITTEAVQALPTGTWTLDRVHSSIGFEVAYLGGSFRGHFNDVDAKLVSEGEQARLEGSARVASIQVKDENLEAHLQAPDFFDAERHPELRFEANDITRAGDELTVRGEITIKGVTQPLELKGTIGSPTTKPDDTEVIGLSLETVLDRTDFGVSWNMPLPDGKPALDNDVKLTADLFFIREA
jgi:polyisoprenoid-binding protein YceI